MIKMDHRLEKRRREVAEGRARSGLSRLAILLVIAAIAGSGAWLVRSPLLSVQTVNVSGATPQLADSVVRLAGIEVGEPLLTVQPGRVEAAVSTNPWVAGVVVTRQWPQTVQIAIEPRLPVAWVAESGFWSLVGADGVVLDTATVAGSALPRIQVESDSARAGGLAFLAELGALDFPGTTVTQQGSEVWANVSGFNVRLGRPVDMEAKARALIALLGTGLDPGATINLLAPTRPALTVANTQPQVEP